MFDKTGTLTHGKPVVTEVEPFGGFDRDAVLPPGGRAREVLASTRSPRRSCTTRRTTGVGLSDVADFAAVPGHGVEGIVDGRRVVLGNRKLMAREGVDVSAYAARIEQLEGEGKTVMLDGRRRRAPRASSPSPTRSRTTQQGGRRAPDQRWASQVFMITGDNRRTAEAIARAGGHRARPRAGRGPARAQGRGGRASSRPRAT